MTSIQMPQLGETIVEGTILKWLKREGRRGRSRRAAVRDLDGQGRHRGALARGGHGDEDPGRRRRDRSGRDGADGGLRGGRRGTSATPPPVARLPRPLPARRLERGGRCPSTGAASSEGSSPRHLRRRRLLRLQSALRGSGAPAPAVAAVATVPDRGPRSQILSPLVRRLAEEHDLDLAQIAGTGSGGRITKADVMAVIASGGEVAPATAGATAPPRRRRSRCPRRRGHRRRDRSRCPTSGGRSPSTCSPPPRRPRAPGPWWRSNVDHLVKLRERIKDTFQRSLRRQDHLPPDGRPRDRRCVAGVPGRQRGARTATTSFFSSS